MTSCPISFHDKVLQYKMSNSVECHSGFAYPEKPVALTWQGQRLEITAIQSQWRTPRGRFFQVETGDGQLFELFYSEADDEWHIQQP